MSISFVHLLSSFKQPYPPIFILQFYLRMSFYYVREWQNFVCVDIGPINANKEKKSCFFLFFSIHVDASVYPLRHEKNKNKNKLYLFYFIFPHLYRCRSCLRKCNYALFFFHGSQKCKWEVDVRCGWKHFLNQISNLHI